MHPIVKTLARQKNWGFCIFQDALKYHPKNIRNFAQELVEI
jgi:hypothetical protein